MLKANRTGCTTVTLRRTTIFFVGSALLCMVVVLHLAVSSIVLRSFEEVERHKAGRRLARVAAELDQVTSTFSQSSWTAPTGSSRFLETGPEANTWSEFADQVMARMDLSAVVFLDAAGGTAFCKAIDPESGRAAGVPPDVLEHCRPEGMLSQQARQGEIVRGLLDTSNGPAIVAACPITAGAAAEPVRGVMVAVRPLAGTVTELFNHISADGYTLQLHSLSDLPERCSKIVDELAGQPAGVHLTVPEDELYACGFRLLRDIYGAPCVLIEITSPRTIYQQGRQTVAQVMRTIAGAGFAFVLLVLLLVERLVLRRLAALSAGVRAIAREESFSQRLSVAGKDELAGLGDDINNMLEALQRSRLAVGESELRYRSVLEHTSDGVFVFSPESGRILEANAAFAKLLGYSADELKNLEITQFVASPLSGELGGLNGDQVYRRRDGGLVHVEAGAHRITCQGRHTLCVVVRDITERKLAEEELAARHAGLEQMVEKRSQELFAAQRQLMQNEKLASVGQLAAGIAHEINTPIQYVGDNLRAISDSLRELTALVEEHQAFVQTVKSGEVTPEIIQNIESACETHDWDYLKEDTPKAIEQGLEGVARVAHIVRAMKDFSHVDREEAVCIDLNHAIRSTLTVTRNEYKYVADVVTELGEIPPVECYPGEINQVLLNIVVNAAHAIADTKQRGTITIRTRQVDEMVEIAIRDTGTGIPEAIRTKVFDPFFTTKEIGKGTGQGLYIAHQVVTVKHGGTLALESEIGKGTKFFIRLPLKAERKPASL